MTIQLLHKRLKAWMFTKSVPLRGAPQRTSSPGHGRGVCVFVCLFDKVNQSVQTTMDSGLYGPQGPFSTLIGQLEPFFIM